jgi:Leucine-rich repeat (LRR) protein
MNLTAHMAMVGSIPSEIGLLTSLNNIDISSNEIYGNIPTDLCRLTKLKVFDAPYNHLNGTIPSCFMDSRVMTDLNFFRVSNNMLSGELPYTATTLPNMASFVIDDNLLASQNFTKIINQMPNIQDLLVRKLVCCCF